MTNAHTILEQLGGNMFVAMTGAKNLLNHGNALSFKLPANFAAKKINSVKITLDEGRDLYNVEFNRIWGTKLSSVSKFDGVYFDDLQRIFTDETGLDTRL